MDKAEMPLTNRGDPVKVTRKASAMVRKVLFDTSMHMKQISYVLVVCQYILTITVL